VLGSLTRLKALSLKQGWTLCGPPISINWSGLSPLRGLEQLDLSGNFMRSFPTFLKGFQRLVALNLSNTVTESLLSGYADNSVPSWLGSLQQLTSLDLSLNQLFYSLPTQLGLLTRLVRLDLTATALASEGFYPDGGLSGSNPQGTPELPQPHRSGTQG